MTGKYSIKLFYMQGVPILLLAVLLFAFAGIYSFILPVLLVLYLLNEKFGDDFLLFISLFLLIGFSGDVGDELRTILNLTAFGIAGILMLKGNFLTNRTYAGFPGTLTVFFIVILLSMVISTLNSGYNVLGSGHTLRQFMFFVLLYFTYNIIREYKDIQKIIDFFILISVFVAITIIESFFSNITSVEKLITEVMVKEGGLFSNVAGPGALIAIALIVMNHRIVSGQGIILTNKNLNIFLTFILVLGLLLTNSRGAMLCAAAGSITYQLLMNRKRFGKIIVWSAGILVLFFLIFSGFFDVINLFFRTERVFENTRYTLWELTWNMIEKNVILGTGPGVPKLAWTQYTNVMFDTWTGDQVMWVFEKGGLGHSHNFLLFRWAELGLLGLFSTIWLYVYFPYKGLKLFNESRVNKNQELHLLSGLVIAVISGIFIRSIIEATGILSHGWISRDFPFWIFILILFRAGNLKTKTGNAGRKDIGLSGY
ncbi:MAG: hypothetical protein FMNOHCHN_02359 [Ignavibacteriaceae bacterium]|nr:hypothetical protein [Ignavibacteriaceae bacterium]